MTTSQEQQRIQRKWLIYSALGMLLTGAGLTISIEAGLLKGAHAAPWQWISLGTLGLIIFNSGIATVAKAALLLAKLRSSKSNEKDNSNENG